jgi:triacylglycerol lipase
VGNVAWVEYVIGQAPTVGTNYRVTHLFDLVPSLPAILSGYAHISPDYFITTPSGVTPTAAVIDVQHGIYNQNG